MTQKIIHGISCFLHGHQWTKWVYHPRYGCDEAWWSRTCTVCFAHEEKDD